MYAKAAGCSTVSASAIMSKENTARQQKASKMEETIKNVCKKAIEVYGQENQTKMFYEEVGELCAALGHYRRGRATRQDVITEIADVLIVTTQLGLMFGDEEVTDEVKRKVNRLASRINEKTPGLKMEYYGN